MLLNHFGDYFAISLAAHVVCFISVLLLRISERSAYHSLCQGFTAVALALLAGSTMLQVFGNNQFWLVGSLSLPLLVLACVIDLKKQPLSRAF